MSNSDRFKLAQTFIMLKALCFCAVLFEYYMASLAPKVNTGYTSMVICISACSAVLLVLVSERRKEKDKGEEILSQEKVKLNFLTTHTLLLQEFKDFSIDYRNDQSTHVFEKRLDSISEKIQKLRNMGYQLELEQKHQEVLVKYLDFNERMKTKIQLDYAKAEQVAQKINSFQSLVDKLLKVNKDSLFNMELG